MKARLIMFDEGVEALLLLPDMETTFFHGDAVVTYKSLNVPFVARCMLLSQYGIKRELILRNYNSIAKLPDGIKKIGFSEEDYPGGSIKDSSDIDLSCSLDELISRLNAHCGYNMSWVRPLVQDFVSVNTIKVTNEVEATSVAIAKLSECDIGLIGSLSSRYVKMFLEATLDGVIDKLPETQQLIDKYGQAVSEGLVQSLNSLTNIRNVFRGKCNSRTITPAAYLYLVKYSVRLFVAGLSDTNKSLEYLFARVLSLLLPTSSQVLFLNCKNYDDYLKVIKNEFGDHEHIANALMDFI